MSGVVMHRKALRREIAIYRRDEQRCFKVCGPSEKPKTQAQVEAQTHGQVAANHADRLDLLLADPVAYMPTLEPATSKGQDHD